MIISAGALVGRGGGELVSSLEGAVVQSRGEYTEDWSNWSDGCTVKWLCIALLSRARDVILASLASATDL